MLNSESVFGFLCPRVLCHFPPFPVVIIIIIIYSYGHLNTGTILLLRICSVKFNLSTLVFRFLFFSFFTRAAVRVSNNASSSTTTTTTDFAPIPLALLLRRLFDYRGFVQHVTAAKSKPQPRYQYESGTGLPWGNVKRARLTFEFQGCLSAYPTTPARDFRFVKCCSRTLDSGDVVFDKIFSESVWRPKRVYDVLKYSKCSYSKRIKS